jgi:ABC-type transporter Mla subunit MlaD
MVGGLAVLGFLMVLFGEAPSWLGGAEWKLHIRVSELAGLDEGTPVYMNGIKVGRVVSMQFLDPLAPEKGVDILSMIKNKYQVPERAQGVCISPALGIGRGRVDIIARGEGASPLAKGGTIPGVMKNPLEDVLPQSVIASIQTGVTQIGNFAHELTPVAADLHELFKVAPVDLVDSPQTPEKISANLYTFVQRADTTMRNLNDVLGDPMVKSNFRESVANIHQMSVDGKLAMSDLRDASATLKVDLASLAQRFGLAVDNMSARFSALVDAAIPGLEKSARVASDLNVITTNLVGGKGTLGKLLVDDRLYEIVVLSFERLSDTLGSLGRLSQRFEKAGRIGISYEGVPVDRKLE